MVFVMIHNERASIVAKRNFGAECCAVRYCNIAVKFGCVLVGDQVLSGECELSRMPEKRTVSGSDR